MVIMLLATLKQFGLLILLTLLLSVAASVMYYFTINISDELDEYRAEGECISKLISTGIARKDIEASHGTCGVKKRP